LTLGTLEISPNEQVLAFSLDLTGEERYKPFGIKGGVTRTLRYTLHFRDLNTGQLLPDVIPETVEFAWGNDSNTVLYCVMDSKTRPYKVYK
jgi:oligopeptidase B